MERKHPLKEIYKIIDSNDKNNKINNIPDFPRIIELEITNICNFNCIMCKTGNGSAKRTKGEMTEEIYCKLIEEIKGKHVALKFVGQGESLINKKFIKYARLAKKENIICHLTTNGSLLTDEMMQELVNIGFDSIKFSFQGVNEEGYYRLRKKNDFWALLQKIEKLKTIRGNLEKPFITICTSVTNETYDEIEEFKNMAMKIADTVEIGTTTLEFLNEDVLSDSEDKRELIELKRTQTLNKIRYDICNQVFDVLTVRWDGSISACCADADGVMVCGNLKTQTLLDVWKGEKLNKYREILANRDYEKLSLCKNCYDYMGYMKKDNRK